MSKKHGDSSKLFQPLRVGKLQLKHRVVMSPLTRARSPAGIPSPLVVEYYSQRATEGGLLISEGMHPSLMGGNYSGVPSMYSPEHIRAWKEVTDAVHAKGGYIFCQIWHVGRVAVGPCIGGRKPLAPSSIKADFIQRFTPVGAVPCEEPVPMTLEDIQDTIADQVHAAKSAMAAGFDGVEIQGGNGYLLEQFLNPNTNQGREDAYGGPVENRARLTLEILQAVGSAIGADRIGVRFSPWNSLQMPESHPNPIEDFTWILERVDKLGLAYITLIQARADILISSAERLKLVYEAARARGVQEDKLEDEISVRSFRPVVKRTPLFSSGEFDAENSIEPMEKGELDGIVFGRLFISNPDLVQRLMNNWPLSPWDRTTFYQGGSKGYVDYPFWNPQAVQEGEVTA